MKGWGRKNLKTHRVHDFFSDFKTFCCNSIQNFWWNWQSFCGKALLYIENACVTIDVEPTYYGMKYFLLAHSYFCLLLPCFQKSWPQRIRGQMPCPCWSVLDFWKINLEKSSSMNWIFSLFRTEFLLPV